MRQPRRGAQHVPGARAQEVRDVSTRAPWRRGPRRPWPGSRCARSPSVRTHVASLSGGQRQTVAIARAVLWNSRVVILDEPTAALGVAQTEQVLLLVRRLADRGLGVVLISHNLNDVFQVADDIAVLYLGQMAAQVHRADVTNNQVVELITAGRSGDLGLPANGGTTSDVPAPARHGADQPTAGGVMAVSSPPTPAVVPQPAAPDESLGGLTRAYVSRVRGGDVGSLPAVLGLVVLVVVFAILRPQTFTNPFNFANLINQSAAVMVIAMGLVFVLLLGEIDLSAGFTAGTSACVMGIVLTKPRAVLVPVDPGRASPPARSSAPASACSCPGSASRRSWSRWRRSSACRADAGADRRGRHDRLPRPDDPRDHEQEPADLAGMDAVHRRPRDLRGGHAAQRHVPPGGRAQGRSDPALGASRPASCPSCSSPPRPTSARSGAGTRRSRRSKASPSSSRSSCSCSWC